MAQIHDGDVDQLKLMSKMEQKSFYLILQFNVVMKHFQLNS